MNFTTQLNKFWVAALVLGTVAFSACKKETEDVCGTPSITDITKTTKRDTTLTTGNLADWIIIRGNNFCNVKQVMFNDVEAPLADAYVTTSEITIRIPRAVPKVVSNKITVTTDGGMAEKTYTLSIPPLSVLGLSNEYTAPGQTAAVVGLNFDLYGISKTSGKVLWAGAQVPITRATSDSVFFVVPASATPGNTVKVVDANSTEAAVPGRYKDDRNVVFGYDTGGSVWGGTTFITTGPTPAPVNGPFIRVNQTIGAWAWTEFSATNLTVPADVVTNPGNYLLKFEVNTLKPFSTNVIKFMIDGDAGSTNTYQWKPPVNTRGKWSTVTIKMSDIVNKGLLASKPQHEFKFIFHGDGALDADISFDTFRVVPKN
ncbi:hypothetical protein ACVWYF_004400 [Hymenobacter sp. UYAg731]